MKYVVLLIALIAPTAVAEEYVCSYPGYASSAEPVIVKIFVDGDTAIFDNKFAPIEYTVLSDDEFGLVLAMGHSEEDGSSQQNLVGLHGFVIDKKKMKMIRGSIFYPDSDAGLRTGTCTQFTAAVDRKPL